MPSIGRVVGFPYLLVLDYNHALSV